MGSFDRFFGMLFKLVIAEVGERRSSVERVFVRARAVLNWLYVTILGYPACWFSDLNERFGWVWKSENGMLQKMKFTSTVLFLLQSLIDTFMAYPPRTYKLYISFSEVSYMSFNGVSLDIFAGCAHLSVYLPMNQPITVINQSVNCTCFIHWLFDEVFGESIINWCRLMI